MSVDNTVAISPEQWGSNLMAVNSPNGETQFRFAELALVGKNEWWRYSLGIVFILAFGLVLSNATTLVLFFMGFDDIVDQLAHLDTIADSDNVWLGASVLALVLFSFVWFLIGTLMTVSKFHDRSWKTVIFAGDKFNWAGFFISFFVVLFIASLSQPRNKTKTQGTFQYAY